LLALLLSFIPKIGPLRSLAFHPATPETQKLFMDSFVQALVLYREKLAQVKRGEKPDLPNTNLDTGEPLRPGAYRLADEAAAKLSKILAAK